MYRLYIYVLLFAPLWVSKNLFHTKNETNADILFKALHVLFVMIIVRVTINHILKSYKKILNHMYERAY